jgi:phosphoribosylaminoimidazole carboxylase (NCAIR synthetase)
LDAELELADPSARTTSAKMAARIRELEPRLAALVGGARVVHEGERADGLRGRAWCPTPSALDRLRGAGALLPHVPSFAVLRRVNHRRFSFDLGPTLPGERWVASIADVAAALATGGRWLVKAPFGFAGRGRLVVEGPLADADHTAVARAVVEGAQLEPWVERHEDHALHGWLAEDGSLVAGELTVQRCDERGAWLASERAPAASPHAAAYGAELVRVARALHDAGYFGPFGIDGFVHGDGALRVRGEINARYSMGWAVGMGDRRPDLG